MNGVMGKLHQIVKEYGVDDIATWVLSDNCFDVWSGSSKPEQHHYGKGRLAEHTLEVIELCLLNNSYFPKEKQVDSKALVLAALFHDVGKIWDYEHDGYYQDWRAAEHKYRIHHISRSVIVWTHAVDGNPQYKPIEDDVTHAILSHHGQRAWGSPVLPATRLAWLLHLCDGISARIDDCDKKNTGLIEMSKEFNKG